MKQTNLEPGLLQVLRVYVIVATIFIAPIWRMMSPLLGVQAGPGELIRPSLPVMVLLIIYTFVPWWQKRMGRAFLPVALVLVAVQAVLGSYITMQSVPPSAHELAVLLFMLRLWINFQILTLFVGWQYDLFWVLATGIGLSLLDILLSFSFINVNGPSYPVYISIIVARVVSTTAAGLGLAWLMKRQREHRRALSEANQKLVHYAATAEQLAVSQERNRLARELHDTLAHSLSGATVQLEAVQALWEVEPSKARQILDQALEVTQNGLTEARRALKSLRASPLEDLGLALAVSDMAKSAAERAGLRLELDVQNHLKNLTADVEQCIYRIAQESLSNVARHAEAKTLHVSLLHDSESLTLTVADDGRGFDVAGVDSARYGLQGLRERAEMVGATLQVGSNLQAGQTGTAIRLIVPMRKGGKP